MELCAIAKHSELAAKVDSIAYNFKRLLNKSSVLDQFRVDRIEIDPIKDPTEILDYLYEAHQVTQFWLEFSRPNSFDKSKLIHDAMGKYIDECHAEEAEVKIKGKQLDLEAVEESVRATSASGNNGKVQFQESPKGPKVTKKLEGNPATMKVENVDAADDKKNALKDMRSLYKTIRHVRYE